MRKVTVNRADGSNVCEADLAARWWSRLRGLLGRRGLEHGSGILIVPCVSVHTWFMLFTIDVLYLSKENEVVKLGTMPPFRFSLGGKRAARVLELPAGTATRLGLTVGEVMSIDI